MTAPSATRMAAEDFLVMEDGGYELVDGELVEVRMGALAVWVVGQVTYWIMSYLHAAKAGGVFLPSDALLHAWPERPDHYRKPDGMFFAKGRLPGDRPPEGTIEIPPDIAIEVVSPYDNARNLEAKVQEYLEAGVRLVWVFYPDSSTVHVYRPGSSAARLGTDDTLEGEDVLPGFSVRVADVFDTTL